MQIAALLLLASALTLQANGLDDLRVALGRMKGQEKLRGTFDVNAWAKAGKGKEMEETTGVASAWVEDDAGGLLVRWDKALLRRAEEEVKAPKGAKKADSPSLGLASITAKNVNDAVNYAPQMLRILDAGQLLQEKPEPYQDKPARLLEVKLVPQSSDGKEKPKEHTYTARIWVGADGLPLGAAITDSVKASMFLISMEMLKHDDLTFAFAADRLVISRREERVNMKTLGVETQMRTLYTFTPK